MLVIQDLSKIYNNGKGIKNISFKIPQGKVAALVGPNGSGKSTTIKIIAGINKADSGQCTFLNHSIYDDCVKKTIGFLPEEPFLYNELSPIQYINFVVSMREINVDEDQVVTLFRMFDLWDHKNQKIGSFSFGMKKKLSVISALIGKPKILILDEPTNGMDTKSIIFLKKAIMDLKANGCIVLISSHIIDFIEKLYDTAIFIKDGTINSIHNYNPAINLEKIYSNTYIGNSQYFF